MRALDDVNLDIAAGEYLAIIGPSGSGKSTLLNAIGLLDKLTDGSYLLEGADVTHLSDNELARTRREKIGFVFQFFHLVPRLTAAQNVELPLILSDVEPSERRERVNDVLQAYGLGDRAHHRPDQLSGGQRQRVAIARATVTRPPVILADEPTGNLDRASGHDVVEILENLNRGGMTLLVVTHDPELASRAARQIRMVDGKIVSDSGSGVKSVTARDVLIYAAGSVLGYRIRTLLTLLAMGIGVASVVMLTALGEGARRFVTGEFQSLGTHLLIVLPGRSETTGGPPPLLGETPRDLTLEDALAIERSRAVRLIAPIAVGSAGVSYREREREVMILGSTAAFLDVRRLKMSTGRFLPAGDPRRSSPLCVLGAKLKNELFGAEPAIGRWVRIGDRRFRVAGTLASEGHSIGVDLGDLVIVPVAAAQALFDSYSLFRILVEARSEEAIPKAGEDIRRIIRQRHEGEDDVTVITQDAVVATFDKIFTALTLTVAGIASISLVVAGILIMNVMLVAVSQRTSEVGLLKALGASSGAVLRVFLAEATILSLVGAAAGVAAGYVVIEIIDQAYPLLSLAAPLWAVASAVLVALITGVLFGVLPARRAAKLDPVAALSGR